MNKRIVCVCGYIFGRFVLSRDAYILCATMSAHEIPLGPCEIDSKVAKMMIDIIQYIYNYIVYVVYGVRNAYEIM